MQASPEEVFAIQIEVYIALYLLSSNCISCVEDSFANVVTNIISGSTSILLETCEKAKA